MLYFKYLNLKNLDVQHLLEISKYYQSEKIFLLKEAVERMQK